MKVVVVGAGHAAGQLVAALRMQQFEGDIRLIGEEPYPPYQRPPLSKQYLSGEIDLESVYFKPADFYDQAKAELSLSLRVEAIDRSGKTVTLSDGSGVDYDKLVLATGTRVRKLTLPGADLEGVHYLRSIEDTDAISRDLRPGARIVVCGGGYIGLEVAAAAVKKGAAVTVLEMADRVMNRVVAPVVSAFYEDLHKANGVDIRTDVKVSGFEGSGRVEKVVTEGGEDFAADLVVVGVGVIPNTELAEEAGLACDNGIVVNEFAQTEDPDILACGDCTNHPSAIYGINVRLESVQNAVDQANAVAKTICGVPTPYIAVPWFWSDQYDVKLQIVGLSQGYDQAVVRGDPAGGSFSVFYLKKGRLIAVDAINSPREYMMGRKLISEGAEPDPEKIVNTDISVKELV
ncbi:MAG: FAD-dependent oxidoreductase [Rhodospirillales bacterium]